MKILSPKIVKKLSKDLILSESTIKKNIYLLAKRYPGATKNALAQIYAQQKGKTVLRMLDNEDRQSLPSLSVAAPIRVKVPQVKLKKVKKEEKLSTKQGLIESLKLKARRFVKSVLNPQTFIGALIVGVILIIIAVLADNHLSKNPGVTSPTPTASSSYSPTPFPSLIKENSLKVDKFISIEKGKSFTDPVSGITVGVNWVLSRSYSELTITFPGKTSMEFEDVKSGRRFDYLGNGGLDYVLTIVEIESDGVKIRIDKSLI